MAVASATEPPVLVEPYNDILESILKLDKGPRQTDLLEIKLRTLILDQIPASTTAVQQTFEKCINVCVHLLGKVDGMPKLSLVLLEDIVEALPLARLEQFYQDVKPLELICSTKLWKQPGNAHVLQFIKVCNKILSRVPPESTLTGKILLQLAHQLPLTDKSSLKPWGSVSSTGPAELHAKEDYEGEDYTFYQTFWSLQEDFKNPYNLSFHTFCAKYTKVLQQLEAFNTKLPSSSSEEPTSLRYLTHSRLLGPQLEQNRKTLRVYILVQFAILQAFLAAQSPQLASSLQSLSKRSTDLMQKLDSGLAKQISFLLNERECMWRNWKKAKCQPPMQLAEAAERIPSSSSPSNTIAPPQDSLEFLKPLQLKDLQKTTSSLPSLQAHLSDYVEALDPEAGIEEEYSPKRDKLLAWQALRLLAHSHLAHFSEMTPRGDFENVVRRVYEKEWNQEIPGEFLEKEAIVDEDAQVSEEEQVDEEEPPVKKEDEEEEGESTKAQEEPNEDNEKKKARDMPPQPKDDDVPMKDDLDNDGKEGEANKDQAAKAEDATSPEVEADTADGDAQRKQEEAQAKKRIEDRKKGRPSNQKDSGDNNKRKRNDDGPAENDRQKQQRGPPARKPNNEGPRQDSNRQDNRRGPPQQQNRGGSRGPPQQQQLSREVGGGPRGQQQQQPRGNEGPRGGHDGSRGGGQQQQQQRGNDGGGRGRGPSQGRGNPQGNRGGGNFVRRGGPPGGGDNHGGGGENRGRPPDNRGGGENRGGLPDNRQQGRGGPPSRRGGHRDGNYRGRR